MVMEMVEFPGSRAWNTTIERVPGLPEKSRLTVVPVVAFCVSSTAVPLMIPRIFVADGMGVFLPVPVHVIPTRRPFVDDTVTVDESTRVVADIVTLGTNTGGWIAQIQDIRP
jgi:hypothetical protein